MTSSLIILLAATVSLAAAAAPAPDQLPAHAMKQGTPTLLSKNSVASWKKWKGPALLAFYGPGKQTMGLKQLAQEYRGKLPLGGVRPNDAALQKMFGVEPKDLPTILVMQNGTPTMRLGGRSDPNTLRTLINSAIGSSSRQSQPPPPPAGPIRVKGSEIEAKCGEKRGLCILVASSRKTSATTLELLGKALKGQHVVHVDSREPQLAVALYGESGAAGADARPDGGIGLLVVKGRGSPRVMHYAGGVGDTRALKQFFDDIQSGLLSFNSFSWPTAAEKPKREGKPTDEAAPPPPPPPGPPPAASDRVSGQYAKQQENIEVVTLEDDDE